MLSFFIFLFYYVYEKFSRTLFYFGRRKSMYNKISQKITEKFITLGVISKDDYEIYKYGFELLIALLLTTIIIILISLFIGKFIETVLYLVGFFSVRVICGGYHAKHHYTCFLTTIFSYFLFLLFNICFYSKPYLNLTAGFMTIVSAILIIAFAPIEHPDNPMTEYRKKRNRFLSLILSIVICLIHFASLFSEIALLYVFNYTAGIFLAALAILAAKIEIVILKRKEERQ